MPRLNRGFSLLEILVAFVILTLSLSVIMRLFSGGLRNIGIAEHHMRAATLAENVLTRLGVEAPLSVGETSGEDGRGYRWWARISEYTLAGAAPDTLSVPVGLYQVDLEVNWGEPGEQHSGVHFSSLRAMPRP